MSGKSFKVSFTLDEADVSYFRSLYRKARRSAAELDEQQVVKDARSLVERVNMSKKTPNFVKEAIQTLEDLTEIIQDADWAAPKSVREQVVAGLAYFSNPDDLIPDHIPALGFLDDAIMVKFVEDEFKHELDAFRKFRRFRDGAEQRPWSSIARERLPRRLEAERRKLRAEIERKHKSEERKGRFGF
jgi:uncharacterized membrane protein YkvA (DUF1232 family)